MKSNTVLTNIKVAQQMDALEIAARKGNPWAQQELFRRSMQFAEVVMTDVKAGADLQNRKEMLSK